VNTFYKSVRLNIYTVAMVERRWRACARGGKIGGVREGNRNKV
jgi:hypothetical protein